MRCTIAVRMPVVLQGESEPVTFSHTVTGCLRAHRLPVILDADFMDAVYRLTK